MTYFGEKDFYNIQKNVCEPYLDSCLLGEILDEQNLEQVEKYELDKDINKCVDT